MRNLAARLALVASLLALTGAAANELPVLWPVPAFQFLDQDGAAFTERALQGRVWIADSIYTQCTAACPILTAQMKLLQRKLQGHAVEFLSFSVDPAHDRPEQLKAYAARWHADERHWRLVDTRDEKSLRAFVAGMHTDLSGSAASGIAHSESFVLIDAQGRVRGRYDSTSPEALQQLVLAAAALADTANPPAPALSENPQAGSVEQGRELFASIGCMGCHAQPQIAPPLQGLAGHAVRLHGGTTVTADDAYLRASILEPERDVVEGYLANMPSYRGQLSDAQIEGLLSYLRSIANEVPAAKGARVRAVDPVCRMAISGSDAGPHARYRGKTFYFCSDACRATFEKNPARFAKSPSP